MAKAVEDEDVVAAIAERAFQPDLVVDAEESAPAVEPMPDVGATSAALDAMVMEKDHVHVENNLLSDHLMRLMMHLRSEDNMQIQLDSLKELDKLYEVEDNQGFLPRSRNSSSHMSFNILSSSCDVPWELDAYRSFQIPNAHEIAEDLSMEERCNIVVAETKYVQDQMNIYRQESERMLDELQATYDEVELRIGEIRRDIGDFRREVVAKVVDKGTKTTNSKHVLKFLKQRIKTTRFTIEKLRKHNTTLYQNIAKIEATLEIKKDLSDVLHVVDFDQLAIQKQQVEARLCECDKEIFQLKRKNLKIEKALEKAQAQLRLLSEQYKVIKATIIEQKPQLLHIKEDMAKASEWKAKSQKEFIQFIKEREGLEGEKKPSVIEYLELKKKMSNLQQMTRAMHIKVEVTDITVVQLGVKLRKAINFNKK